jgi:hypothetical protein
LTTTKYESHLFAEALLTALKTRNLEMNEFSKLVDITYEHGRKLCKGLGFPSKHLLRTICTALELSYEQMQKKVETDKIRKKHGAVLLELAGKDPKFERFEHILLLHDDSQLQDLYLMARAMAQPNGAVFVAND